MEHLPSYISVIFSLIVVVTYFLFLNAWKNKIAVAAISLLWLAFTGIAADKGFFLKTNMPPGLVLGMIPPFLLIVLSIATKRGRKLIDSIDLSKLTLLHTIRIPVEIVLLLLSTHKLVPELMTFTGRNFDILSGITAPLIYFICFHKSQLRFPRLLLAWNFVCVGLLLNVVINAILSAPFPFQQFAFDQPNIAVLYFPFIWLPTFVVVIVLFSHVVAIKQLLRKRETKLKTKFVVATS